MTAEEFVAHRQEKRRKISDAIKYQAINMEKGPQAAAEFAEITQGREGKEASQKIHDDWKIQETERIKNANIATEIKALKDSQKKLDTTENPAGNKDNTNMSLEDTQAYIQKNE